MACRESSDGLIGYAILIAVGGLIAAALFQNGKINDQKVDINKIEARVISEPQRAISYPAPIINITNNMGSNNVETKTVAPAPTIVRHITKPRYTKIIHKTVIVNRPKKRVKHVKPKKYGCVYGIRRDWGGCYVGH